MNRKRMIIHKIRRHPAHPRNEYDITDLPPDFVLASVEDFKYHPDPKSKKQKYKANMKFIITSENGIGEAYYTDEDWNGIFIDFEKLNGIPEKKGFIPTIVNSGKGYSKMLQLYPFIRDSRCYIASNNKYVKTVKPPTKAQAQKQMREKYNSLVLDF